VARARLEPASRDDLVGADFRTLANALRARRTGELLAGTGASITEIAAELGYSAPANFARAFRKATGAAPQEFRSRLMLRR
jgi:AraC-like DNA-binding protein